MRNLGNDASSCTKPEIIASRLTSIRNIYLRQELRTISNQIQENYKQRLPMLQLVSIAAYEQVFNRQPLSLPEELRREAVKYGLKYYQLNMKKLRMVEAQNGLCQNHGQLSSFEEASDSQRSVSLKKNNSKYNSNRSTLTSTTNTNILNSTDVDDSIATSVSSSFPINEQGVTSTSTFSDTNISSSSTEISSDTMSNSPSIDSLSEPSSNVSIISTKTDQLSASTKKSSRTKSPKIIVHRASDSSLTSITTDKKQLNKVHRSSANKRRSRKKYK